MSENIHVVPIGDLRPHTETGYDCECDPKTEVTENDPVLVIHNAFDGRDIIEEIENG